MSRACTYLRVFGVDPGAIEVMFPEGTLPVSSTVRPLAIGAPMTVRTGLALLCGGDRRGGFEVTAAETTLLPMEVGLMWAATTRAADSARFACIRGMAPPVATSA